MKLVEQAIDIDDKTKEYLRGRMSDRTGLENPNSVTQMKDWLSEQGIEAESLDKKAVKEMLSDADEDVADVLTCRQQLAKASVNKYRAMQKAVCADGRARGMFAFYGANRTGRWAGRIIKTTRPEQPRGAGLFFAPFVHRMGPGGQKNFL